MLDPQQAQRLYDALAADDPDIPQKLKDLLDVVEGKIDPSVLQKTLDHQNSPLAKNSWPDRICLVPRDCRHRHKGALRGL